MIGGWQVKKIVGGGSFGAWTPYRFVCVQMQRIKGNYWLAKTFKEFGPTTLSSLRKRHPSYQDVPG